MLSLPPEIEGRLGQDSDMKNKKGDRRLDIALFLLATLFVVLALSFIGFYYYTKYTLEQETPMQKNINEAMQAIRNDPRSTAARVRLGVLYTQIGRFDDAIDQFDQALKVTRDDQEALLYAGIAYMNKKKYNEALEYFDREIKYYKNTAMANSNTSLEQAYYYGAVAHWKKKEYDKAIDYLNKALVIKKASSDTYLILGRVYLDKKLYNEALSAFQKALEFDPSYADAFYGSGLAFEGKGETAKALESYKTALKIKPDFKAAKNAIQRLEKKTK